MGRHLETVTLEGRQSHMPGIPNRDMEGILQAEASALIFRANHHHFALAIPYEQIKECYAFTRDNSLVSLLSNIFTLGLWPSHDWLISLTYYSGTHDMDISLLFLLGNSASGPLVLEARAIALAKNIWTLRSKSLTALREVMMLRYR